MATLVTLNLVVFIILLLLLYWLQKRHVSFPKRVFSGLGLGILFGTLLQLFYNSEVRIISKTLEYINIVGTGYIRFLQMVIIPLIMVSIISAIVKLRGNQSLGKISSIMIGMLILTTVIAALIAIIVTHFFGLTAEGLINIIDVGQQETQRMHSVEKSSHNIAHYSFAKMITDFIPANPFLDMTGQRSMSTIAVVIFSIFIGISALNLAKKKQEMFDSFSNFIQIAYAVVMRIVTLVLRLTPYGILALITKVIASSDYNAILKLINFVIASYVAIGCMYLIHLFIVSLNGLNPLRFVKKTLPLLLFAFTSRTSAGSIPLSIRTQTQAIGIPESIANFAASFGATIGQNGCAGIYPAMLAFMVAPTLGINPWDIGFIVNLILIISISSFGVAGVGGGATFAALIVFSMLNFPIELIGLLISVEPLIDMGRTALNVSGSVTAGTTTARVLGELDMATFHRDDQVITENE